MLVHGEDIARGFGLRLDPPRDLCARVLARMFPHLGVDLTAIDPWMALLWATNRVDLPGHERQTRWRWRANRSTSEHTIAQDQYPCRNGLAHEPGGHGAPPRIGVATGRRGLGGRVHGRQHAGSQHGVYVERDVGGAGNLGHGRVSQIEQGTHQSRTAFSLAYSAQITPQRARHRSPSMCATGRWRIMTPHPGIHCVGGVRGATGGALSEEESPPVADRGPVMVRTAP